MYSVNSIHNVDNSYVSHRARLSYFIKARDVFRAEVYSANKHDGNRAKTYLDQFGDGVKPVPLIDGKHLVFPQYFMLPHSFTTTDNKNK